MLDIEEAYVREHKGADAAEIAAYVFGKSNQSTATKTYHMITRLVKRGIVRRSKTGEVSASNEA